MSINLITGVPGSGKTCLALKLFTDKYYNYSKKHDQFFLKQEWQDITLITNIEDLKLPHINLDEAIRASKLGFDGFFTVDYQKKISQKYPKIVYVLDECQRFLSKRLKSAETVFYFDYHRHLGHDVWLITQDIKKVTMEISTLIDFEYRLTKRHFALAGEFRYLIKSSGDIVDRKAFRPPSNIFRLYKSFEAPSLTKVKSVFRKFILVPLIIFLIAAYWFYDRIMPDHDKAHASNSPKTVSSASSSPSVPVDLPPIYAPKRHALPIENTLLINDQLRWFQDPVTGKVVKPFEVDYVVYRQGKRWFADISPAEYRARVEYTLGYKPPDDQTATKMQADGYLQQQGDRVTVRGSDPAPANAKGRVSAAMQTHMSARQGGQ